MELRTGGSAFGAEVDYAELGTGIIKWNLLETLTYAADATKTTTETLTGYSFLRIVGSFLCSNTTTVTLLVNGLTTAVYNFISVQDNAVALSSAASIMNVAYGHTTTQQTIDITFTAVSAAIADGKISFVSNSSCIAGSSGYSVQKGHIQLGNADPIVSFTLAVGTGTLTGTVKIYGGNL